MTNNRTLYSDVERKMVEHALDLYRDHLAGSGSEYACDVFDGVIRKLRRYLDENLLNDKLTYRVTRYRFGLDYGAGTYHKTLASAHRKAEKNFAEYPHGHSLRPTRVEILGVAPAPNGKRIYSAHHAYVHEITTDGIVFDDRLKGEL